MLNFIVCEDDHKFRQQVKQQINNFMMNCDMSYRVYEFDGYDKEFENLATSDIGFKVYLLDIKAKPGSGIDAARYIREELDDWISLIVIITAFSEYRYEALTNRLFLLNFISKVDHCMEKLKDVLKIIMKNYGNRGKTLSYEYNYVVYQIEYRHIVYIEKEQDSKRCIVQTTYGNFKVPKSIIELEKILDKRFLKVHRSLIVNTEKIQKYDIKENEIIFNNGMSTNLISRSKKKELIEYVTSNH